MIYKIKALLEITWLIILPLIISHLVIYLIGSFLAWSWDPREWWLITSTWGRVLAVLIELSIIANIPKFWDDFNI
jgi:hypothetical protein